MINKIPDFSEGPERVDREKLIELAREKPLRDPEVEKMFKQWLEETCIPETPDTPSVDYIEVAIMHAVMKYRLGFMSKEEVLEELEQAGGLLASEPGDTTELHNELSQLLYAIEDDTFDVI